MTFNEALEHRRRQNFGPMFTDQDFRHGWNAALHAVLDVLDAEDDLQKALKAIGEMGVEVQT